MIINIRRQDGFTLIELLVAMTVFSFMLLIIVVGFINIVRLHNQALAANLAQDNARTAMDTMVQAVRDSTGIVRPTAGSSTVLCLNSSAGPMQAYYVATLAGVNTLFQANTTDCASFSGATPVTSSSINVADFQATLKTSGPQITKPEVDISITVGSSNGTTNGGSGGVPLRCKNTPQDRAFCSVVTLTSGAEPR